MSDSTKDASVHTGALTPLLANAPGRQSYFLDVTGPANAKALSVVSFEAVERMGEPYRIVIELTHPEALAREDYLGRDARFTIAPAVADALIDSSAMTAPRTFSGCITGFSQIKTTRDFSAYRIVVEAHIARLSLTRSSRIYQQQSAPQIIEAILRRHGFKGHQFSFTLRRTYPTHAFRFQYQLADWPYIHLLMQQEGIYSTIIPGEFGDVVVFADDIDHYLYKPALTVPYREVAGLQSGEASVFALQTHAQTVPASFAVADYNPEQAYERLRAEANVASKDVTTYGQPYVYGTHHLDASGAAWEAQLRHEAAVAWQVQYEGESSVLELCPARILRMDTALADAPNGQLIVAVTHRGARDASYRNHYTAIPSDRRFRLKLDEAHWPKIPGTLSARVTSPGQYTYAYLTVQGYYTVRFDCDFDFDTWNPGGESVPLRLAKPFAGSLQTGFHFPALDGAEAVIAFRDGDPNKPYIAQFHHHSQAIDLVTNQDRWLSRNVIRTQSNNKLRMEDWKGQEHIKLSTEHSGKSQLNLGHLVDNKKQPRGEGFELRSSGHGAIRGGKGLFISADDQLNAGGKQLDMQAAQGLLEQALQQSEAQAVAADYGRQKALLNDTLMELRKAGLLVSAPAGMALASGADLQLSAKENLIATAGGHADVSVLKRFTVAAGEAVSVFAQKLGIKLFAAKGKVEIQAQSDEMRLLADQNVTITSANGRVVIEAKDELLLKCGGSYLLMKSTGIEEGTRGERTIKSVAFSRQGPSSLAGAMNTWKHATFDEQLSLRWPYDGAPMRHQKFALVRPDKSVIRDTTDGDGNTGLQKSLWVEGMHLLLDP
ncbi:type VI secretion system Vgr family protein [Rhodanobacter sp. MP7CTX1]|uniref:type VI secretion system Vgr family protein n=1 Tax=Rhodanobacter sp. MP7CTX1 TaxID=2723084 RepID=UPI00161E595F|nr:type VI secretion system Vgr family protein [Rhodanobacter sp. MP7CTX1]MBB6186046.1 type VI secretion system secreted protein VgrG [Rhodanobacter sp. MP7CTX1]